MTKSSKLPRAAVLPLNFKNIKKTLPSFPQTNLVVSRDNVDSQPLSQNIIRTWMLSLSEQVFLSRNKLGRELLQRSPLGFNLNDPFIRETRFYVDYHRLHDPALKRYHNSVPVKNRLAKLQMVTKHNDAICTQKEFVDYLRYIDKNIAITVNESEKFEDARKLSDHFQKLGEAKEQESQYIGIFRKEKLKKEPKSNAYLDKEKKAKPNRQLKKVNAAIERAAKIKKDKATRVQIVNQAKEEKLKHRMQTIRQTEQKRKIEMHKTLDDKLKEAQERRQSLRTDKKTTKMKEDLEHFTKHLAFRQEAHSKDIELLEMYQKQQHANLKARKKKNEMQQERIENKTIKSWKNVCRKEGYEKQKVDLVDEIVKYMEKSSVKYMKKVDPDNFEVSRRFSMLTRPLVVDCIRREHELFQILKMHIPPTLFVARAIRMMQLRVLTVPQIGNSKCEFIRQKIAEIISKTTINVIELSARKSINFDHIPNESEKIISEAEPPYIEFMGSLPGLRSTIFEENDDLNKEIRKKVKEMFEIITKCEFDFSDTFKTREFVHLYDFQKYILHESIRDYIELVKMKKNWFQKKQRKNISSWKALDLNLDEISFKAADSVMDIPYNTQKFADCIRKISRLMCVEIDAELQQEVHIDTVDPEVPEV